MGSWVISGNKFFVFKNKILGNRTFQDKTQKAVHVLSRDKQSCVQAYMAVIIGLSTPWLSAFAVEKVPGLLIKG